MSRAKSVFFTKEKETADECIERLVGEFSNRRRQIYVATSDFVEQHIIFAQGALRISARELHLEIEENQKQVKKAIEPGSISSTRHALEDKLPPDVRSKLENWRRQ